MPNRPARWINFRNVLRYKHYSLRNKEACLRSVKFLVRWHGRIGQLRRPRDLGTTGVQQFLEMLTTQRHGSLSIQNQLRSALLFLYRQVMAVQLLWLDDLQRATRPQRIPSVLTSAEMAELLNEMAQERVTGA